MRTYEHTGLIAANQALLAHSSKRSVRPITCWRTLEGVMPSQIILPDTDRPGFSLRSTFHLSLPSDLVNQRPDILSAEAQMHVASANIGVATAAMFPSSV